MTISDLHCGQRIPPLASVRLRLFGACKSAIQSSRHDSCAVSAQGHGERHSEDSGPSSVSSEKQIQHFWGSNISPSAEEETANDVATCGS